jgi:hypothetical protein
MEESNHVRIGFGARPFPILWKDKYYRGFCFVSLIRISYCILMMPTSRRPLYVLVMKVVRSKEGTKDVERLGGEEKEDN